MRELKFRGKSIYKGKWVYGYYLFLSNKYHLICSGRHTRMSGTPERDEVIHETVGQFTGLLDKNGVEIYEGDRVLCWYGQGIVIFHAGCFMVEWEDDSGCLMEFLFSRNGKGLRMDEDAFDVIGNIHDK